MAQSDKKSGYDWFTPDLHQVVDETSVLTEQQKREQDEMITELNKACTKFEKELARQSGSEEEKKWTYDHVAFLQGRLDYLHMREHLYHFHTSEEDRWTVFIYLAKMALLMLRQGLKVIVVNVNFFQRMQTLAFYRFLRAKADVLEVQEGKPRPMLYLKIQVEDADDVDQGKFLQDLQDVAEDWPLFVVTDETCKEVERLDEAVAGMTDPACRYHFFCASLFGHGSPPNIDRKLVDTAYRRIPPPIQQVMEMALIDTDNDKISKRPRFPLLRTLYPKHEFPPGYNIRENLYKLHVHLISHSRDHVSNDVWDCKPCGEKLAEYLNTIIELGKPGLRSNEVFVVGSLKRFETKVTVPALPCALMKRNIDLEVMFGRHAVKIKDIIERMDKLVVSDEISMRGIDKKIVIVIPSERNKALLHRLKRTREEVLREEEESKKLKFVPPSGEATTWYTPELRTEFEPKEKIEWEWEGTPSWNEECSDDEEGTEMNYPRSKSFKDMTFEEKMARLHFRHSDSRSTLKRALASLERSDKNMIIDVCTDAPHHVVLFHFADEEEANATDEHV